MYVTPNSYAAPSRGDRITNSHKNRTTRPHRYLTHGSFVQLRVVRRAPFPEAESEIARRTLHLREVLEAVEEFSHSIDTGDGEGDGDEDLSNSKSGSKAPPSPEDKEGVFLAEDPETKRLYYRFKSSASPEDSSEDAKESKKSQKSAKDDEDTTTVGQWRPMKEQAEADFQKHIEKVREESERLTAAAEAGAAADADGDAADAGETTAAGDDTEGQTDGAEDTDAATEEDVENG